jgi:NlpC/P60 family putative phage cell wall peptidase
MVTRAAIVAEALSWVGTPYKHLQNLKGPQGGVDCAYLLYSVALAVGCLDPRIPRPVYSPQWHLHQHEERYRHALERAGCQVAAWDDRHPGDILLVRFGHVANHAAVLITREDIVHADHRRGVLHQPIPPAWGPRIMAVYRFPGVEETAL